jgi:hypothetical protein
MVIHTTINSIFNSFSTRCFGQMGGRVKVPKGFSTNIELSREAGSRGGKISNNSEYWKLKRGL